MDEIRFDGLSRVVGSSGSRRRAASLVAAGATAAVLARFTGDEAEAKKKKRKCKIKRCGPGTTQNGKVCEVSCPAGQIKVDDQCVTGQGTCTAGQTSCGVSLGNAIRCNNAQGCHCLLSSSGATRCGKLLGDGLRQCGQCTTDAQCSGFGTGAFCVISTNNAPNTNCSCPTIGQGFCSLPC